MQFDRLKRRDFIALLGNAAAWPLVAHAQQTSGKYPRIGAILASQNENFEGFLSGLREAGYVDGQNMRLEVRFFGSAPDRLEELTRELVALKCSASGYAAPSLSGGVACGVIRVWS